MTNTKQELTNDPAAVRAELPSPYRKARTVGSMLWCLAATFPKCHDFFAPSCMPRPWPGFCQAVPKRLTPGKKAASIIGRYIIKILWIMRRKFRSQTSDNMDRWKAEMERVREKRKIRREKSRRKRVRRKKMQMREKVRKSRNTVFFEWFVAPEGRKVGSLKRRVRSQLARWEMNNCTPLWRKAHFQVKMYITHQVRTTFGSWHVEKVHALVARSTFRSQNVQNTRGSVHFWRFRCRFGWQAQGILHLVKSEENVKVLKRIFNYNHHYTTLHSDTLHYTTTTTTPSLHSTTLHSTTLHCTQLHSVTLHYTTLHYTISSTLHYTTVHYTTFHYTSLHYTTLHSATLQLQLQRKLHSTTLHCAKLHYTTALHYITLHSLHSTTLHYITLHYITLNDTAPQIDR